MILISLDLLFALMFLSFVFLFCGDGFQIKFEPVKTLLPEPAVMLHPIRNVLERFAVELARTPLRVARLGDEAGALEHFQVLGYGRKAHLAEEWPGQFGDIGLALRELRED